MNTLSNSYKNGCEQPDDYTDNIFDKAALVNMTAEALESIKAST